MLSDGAEVGVFRLIVSSDVPSDDVEVGVFDPCYIYGSQTLMFINGG